MKRVALGLALMCPSVCLASGDVSIVWWTLGGMASYLFAAAVLGMMLYKQKIRWPRMVSFVLMAVVVWYWCAMQVEVHPAVLLLLLIVAPLLFLVRSK